MLPYAPGMRWKMITHKIADRQLFLPHKALLFSDQWPDLLRSGFFLGVKLFPSLKPTSRSRDLHKYFNGAQRQLTRTIIRIVSITVPVSSTFHFLRFTFHVSLFPRSGVPYDLFNLTWSD